MRCRKNVKDLSGPEKTDFVQAVLALKNSTPSQLSLADYNGLRALVPTDYHPHFSQPTNRYDDYVLMHLAVQLGGHRRPAFLPWHRRYLELFEADLQAASGNPDLTIPYWDWSDPASTPFTSDFLGGDGDPNDDYKVTTGSFAHTTGDWTLNIITGLSVGSGAFDAVNYLRRHIGRNSGPGLDPTSPVVNVPPTPGYIRDTVTLNQDYDVSPWNHNQVSSGFRNRLEGWINGPQLHNLGHVLTGGTMLPPSSPNDPVFWLNHSMVDMVWAAWQQRFPSKPYLPGDSVVHSNLNEGGVGRHRLNDNMKIFGDFAGPNATPASTLDWTAPAAPAAPYAYQIDLPIITNETGTTIAFGDVPEDLTTYRGARFGIKSCRPVRFRIVTPLVSPFGLTPAGNEFLFTPGGPSELDEQIVFLQFTSDGSGPATPSSVTIRAFIDDDEGYFANNPGDEHQVGEWTFTLTANAAPRDSTGMVLVLDYSNSMNGSAGPGTTRKDLLVKAVSVIGELTRSDDGIGMVRYNTTAAKLVDVTPMAAGVAASHEALAAGTTASGNTSIGAGIIEGAAVLASAPDPYDQTATIVLTDGRENTAPLLAAPSVSGLITGTTYAIGLGRPSHVNVSALNAITQNSGGDLVVTGDITDFEQRFLLAKYFVQVLAGITSMTTILDPRGELVPGAKHRIPFHLTEADVSADIAVISDFPKVFRYQLETPAGKVIDAAAAASEPNIDLRVGRGVAFFRVRLPALPAAPEESHAGEWALTLDIDERALKHLLRKEKELWALLAGRGVLAYETVINAVSNLKLHAQLHQEHYAPGARVSLRSTLLEYGQPLTGADVIAEVTRPDGSATHVVLAPEGAGRHGGEFIADTVGLWKVRVRATGRTSRGSPFTAEKTLTAATVLRDPRGDGPHAHDDWGDKMCDLLACILDHGFTDKIRSRIKKLGLDLDAVRSCLGRCEGRTKQATEPTPPMVRRADLRAATRSAFPTLLRRAPADTRAEKAEADIDHADGYEDQMNDPVGYTGKEKMSTVKPPAEEDGGDE